VPTTVLIVDDHPSFRRLARRLFEEAGFSVVGEAANGRSALHAAVTLKPDLVLLDVMLPDANGLDVAELLPPSVTVLLVSSRSADDLAISPMSGHRFLRKDELTLAWLRSVADGASG
jgi:DNA-binding NarL/FixJ family response regulator